MVKGRIVYYDFLRSFAIILVIVVHSFSASFSDGVISISALAIRNLCNIAVPIFLALSGFFMAQKNLDSGNYFPFIKKQLIRVWLPVLFCSLPLLFLDILHGRHLFYCLINFFFCGYSVYYFVAVIIQCYLLIPCLNWVNKRFNNGYKVLLVFTLFLCVLSWTLKTYVLPYYGIKLPLILYAGGFWMWSVFFVLGFYLGKNKCNIPAKMLILFALFSFALCCVESLYLNAPSSLEGVGQKPSPMLFSFFVILILLSEQVKIFFEKIHSRIFDFLVKIGFYSFGIYLIHCYILMFVKFSVKKCLQMFSEQNSFIQWTCLIIATLFISFSILRICKRLFPRFTRLFLGV